MRAARLIVSTCFVGSCLGAFAQPAPAPPVVEKIYIFDTNHTTIGFSIPIFAMGEVTGKFTDFTGKIVVPDEADLTKATVEVVIKTDSIDTGNEDRDKHLRTADFFDAAKFPEITFKSKKILKVGSGYSLVGDFSMRGVNKKITIPFQLTGHDITLGAHASFPLNRKEYGVSWSRIMDDGAIFLPDEVTIEIGLLTRTGMTAEELAKYKANKSAHSKD